MWGGGQKITKTENKGTEPRESGRCGDIATLLLNFYGTWSKLLSPEEHES